MVKLRSETLSLKEYIEGDYKVREVVKIIYTEKGRPYEIHGKTLRPLHPDPEKVARFLKTASRLADIVEERLAMQAMEKASSDEGEAKT